MKAKALRNGIVNAVQRASEITSNIIACALTKCHNRSLVLFMSFSWPLIMASPRFAQLFLRIAQTMKSAQMVNMRIPRQTNVDETSIMSRGIEQSKGECHAFPSATSSARYEIKTHRACAAAIRKAMPRRKCGLTASHRPSSANIHRPRGIFISSCRNKTPTRRAANRRKHHQPPQTAIISILYFAEAKLSV